MEISSIREKATNGGGTLKHYFFLILSFHGDYSTNSASPTLEIVLNTFSKFKCTYRRWTTLLFYNFRWPKNTHIHSLTGSSLTKLYFLLEGTKCTKIWFNDFKPILIKNTNNDVFLIWFPEKFGCSRGKAEKLHW